MRRQLRYSFYLQRLFVSRPTCLTQYKLLHLLHCKKYAGNTGNRQAVDKTVFAGSG